MVSKRHAPHIVIIRLGTKNDTWYMEWNVETGAPQGWGMPLEEFIKNYVDHYGSEEADLLPARMLRMDFVVENKKNAPGGVIRRDCSDPAHDKGVLLDCNYAGYNESRLDVGDIIEWYCIKRELPPEYIVRKGKMVPLGEPQEQNEEVDGLLDVADDLSDEYEEAFEEAQGMVPQAAVGR